MNHFKNSIIFFSLVLERVVEENTPENTLRFLDFDTFVITSRRKQV
jgi:hypothetical protein